MFGELGSIHTWPLWSQVGVWRLLELALCLFWSASLRLALWQSLQENHPEHMQRTSRFASILEGRVGWRQSSERCKSGWHESGNDGAIHTLVKTLNIQIPFWERRGNWARSGGDIYIYIYIYIHMFTKRENKPLVDPMVPDTWVAGTRCSEARAVFGILPELWGFFLAKFCWGNKAGTEKALELFPHAHLLRASTQFILPSQSL